MRRKRMRSQMSAIDQINVTPLLDLTFLLLIVFMITMPLMEYGTSVNPPEMNGEKLPEDHFTTISLTKTGTIMLNNDAVTKGDLVARLREYKARDPKMSLLLRADGEQQYKEVIDLMTLIRNSGFPDVTLVTRAEGR